MTITLLLVSPISGNDYVSPVSAHAIAQDAEEIGGVREVISGIPWHDLLLYYHLHWIPNYDYVDFVIANLTYMCSNLDDGWYFEISHLSVNLTERIYSPDSQEWSKGMVINELSHDNTSEIRFYPYDRVTFLLYVSGQCNYEGENSLFLDMVVEVTYYDENSTLHGGNSNIWQVELADSDCPIVDLSAQIQTSETSSTTSETGITTSNTTSSTASTNSLYNIIMLSVICVSSLIILVFSSRTILYLKRK